MSAAVFAPCTKPTADALNALSAALAAIYAAFPVAQAINLCGPPEQSEARFTLQRRHRFLVFKSNGTIEDPAGLNDPVSLSEGDDEFTVKDLDQIDWLVEGTWYRVTGVSTCFEDWEA